MRILFCLGVPTRAPRIHHRNELTEKAWLTSYRDEVNVFTGADLGRRNLLYKYRGFWTYFEDEKWRYACWDMTYFIAFSFSYTATFFQTWIRATCLTKLSKQTTTQPSISFTIEDYRQIIIIVATQDSEKWLYLCAYWLRSIFYFYSYSLSEN